MVICVMNTGTKNPVSGDTTLHTADNLLSASSHKEPNLCEYAVQLGMGSKPDQEHKLQNER